MEVNTDVVKITFVKNMFNVEIKNNFNSDIINNCRKQRRLNYGNRWIMHLHHIGLPPATDNNSMSFVSGNFILKTDLL